MNRNWKLTIAIALAAVSLISGCHNASSGEVRNSNQQTANSRQSHSELLDLNTASKADLTALPGIGEAYAQHIIDNRPYREKSDLVRKNVIPESTYEKIRDKVVAKQH